MKIIDNYEDKVLKLYNLSDKSMSFDMFSERIELFKNTNTNQILRICNLCDIYRRNGQLCTCSVELCIEYKKKILKKYKIM